ncbi:MAG: short-chain dehydrogenase [Rhodospirillaceae bacterium]|nr:short-chain dehydrogenase [Rhodospirillaceae bacterium]|tara:strand:+ start:163 stop:852 length:690 start_codon:yes stop_codon:yes gene_type:complete
MQPLTGRRILITGGTRGIGRAAATCLSDAGASVFISGRNRETVDAACTDLNLPGKVCDVADYDSCRLLLERATHSLGGLDAVINSAGVGDIKNIEDASPADWRQMIEINLIGTFNICKAAIPFLKASARADIINLGSRAGRYAFAGGTAYCASKSGIQGFSEALFLDLEKYGVSVSLIAPGPVNTGFPGVDPDNWTLRPEDVATAIRHCLESDRGANLNWIEMRPSRRP